MKKVQVAVKKDFIESISSAKPLDALAELIWNGFDANANKVQVYFKENDLGVIDEISIRDSGYGINHDKIDEYFGSLGDSWKKTQGRQNTRTLHGKNGKGRFKAFSLGEKVEWKSVFNQRGENVTFSISGSSNALDNFDASDPVKSDEQKTGTDVTIFNMQKDFRALRADNTPIELAKIFALYLTEYPEISLEYDGTIINPNAVKTLQQEYPLGDVELPDGTRTPVSLVVIEWGIKTERGIHLCDANGVSLHELPAGRIKAPGFNFTAYIKSPHFRELDKTNLLPLADLNQDVQAILTPAKSKISEHFRRRILDGQSKIVEKWKKENIYPYEEKSHIDPLESVERQVFDILAVSVQSYLPSFESADNKSKKFTFKLLAQAIKDNPDSVQTIIGEVLCLKKEQQDDLAELLGKTNLSSIISSAKIIADRLDFLKGLENLLFDEETKATLLERDQLHKILENEAWLFHEEFALACSEESLETVLQKHLAELGDRSDDSEPVDVGNGKRGRIDLMLQKAIQPRVGEFDYLVIELKRPSKKIDTKVLSQIENYAMAVANDERFQGIKAKWNFVVISNEFDDVAKKKANQRDRPKGMVYNDADLNITVWAKSWAEVLGDAKARLSFVNEQLSYQADRDSSKSYLTKAHAKYIPESTSNEPTFDEVQAEDGDV